MKADKKFEEGAIRFVLCPRLGEAYVSKEVTWEVLQWHWTRLFRAYPPAMLGGPAAAPNFAELSPCHRLPGVPASPSIFLCRGTHPFMSYAIIKTGGKQYRVAEGDVIQVEKLDVEAGAETTFSEVLFLSSGDSFKTGGDLKGASRLSPR